MHTFFAVFIEQSNYELLTFYLFFLKEKVYGLFKK